MIIVGFFIGPLIYFRWKKWIWIFFFAWCDPQSTTEHGFFEYKIQHKKSTAIAVLFLLDQMQIILQMTSLNNLHHFVRHSLKV
jgi:hypothetical protein